MRRLASRFCIALAVASGMVSTQICADPIVGPSRIEAIWTGPVAHIMVVASGSIYLDVSTFEAATISLESGETIIIDSDPENQINDGAAVWPHGELPPLVVSADNPIDVVGDVLLDSVASWNGASLHLVAAEGIYISGNLSATSTISINTPRFLAHGRIQTPEGTVSIAFAGISGTLNLPDSESNGAVFITNGGPSVEAPLGETFALSFLGTDGLVATSPVFVAPDAFTLPQSLVVSPGRGATIVPPVLCVLLAHGC